MPDWVDYRPNQIWIYDTTHLTRANTEIVDALFMSPATAKTHVSRLLAKRTRGTAPGWSCSPTKRVLSPREP